MGDKFGPFAIGYRTFTMRVGPAAWPLPGAGCWVRSTTDGQTVLLAVVSLSDLKAASSLVHMDHLAQAIDHKGAKDIKIQRAIVQPGCMCWVPWGWVAIPTGVNDITTASVIPWMRQDLYSALDEETKGLISTGIMGFAKKNCDKKPWSNILDALNDFFK